MKFVCLVIITFAACRGLILDFGKSSGFVCKLFTLLRSYFTDKDCLMLRESLNPSPKLKVHSNLCLIVIMYRTCVLN